MDETVPVCYYGMYNTPTFPDLVYNINGTNYYMPWESYVMCEGWYCYIMILTHDTIGSYILGLNFLSNYYTIFDQENSRIGMAVSANAI